MFSSLKKKNKYRYVQFEALDLRHLPPDEGRVQRRQDDLLRARVLAGGRHAAAIAEAVGDPAVSKAVGVAVEEAVGVPVGKVPVGGRSVLVVQRPGVAPQHGPHEAASGAATSSSSTPPASAQSQQQQTMAGAVTAYVPHPVHLATNYTLLRVMEERYGDDRIGPRLLFPTPPPVPPPVPPPDWPPATATPSPPEGPTVIIVRSTQAQESSGQGSDKRVCKVLVNVAVLICLVIFLVVRYCR
ncbi:hypothetical protein FOCC_FOCC011230 [Frankliniella occidentalis]|nr:hypothetical protein FOCC_FOCC011230 [Frankliniella occidentalis]